MAKDNDNKNSIKDNSDMRAATEKLVEANQVELTKVLNNMKETMSANGNQMSDFSKDILSQAQKIAGDNRFMNKSDQKKTLKEIAVLENSIALEKNDMNKELVRNQLNALKQTTKENTRFASTISDSIVNNIDSIGGVIAGVMGDSPILAVATSKMIEMFKDGAKNRQELKQKELEIAENKFDTELANSQSEDSPEFAEGSNADDNPELEPDEGDNANEVLIPAVERVADGIDVMNENLAERVMDDEEQAREDKAAANKKSKATKGAEGLDEADEVEEAGSGGIFAALGISKLIGSVTGGLSAAFASLGSTLLTVFTSTLPKLLFKAFTKVFLPLLFVAGLINGIMDAVDIVKKGGTIQEAVMAGLGGFFDFLTFGLLNTETFTKIGTVVGEAVANAIQSVANFFAGDESPFNKLVDNIMDLILPIVDHITEPFKRLWGLVTDLMDVNSLSDVGKIVGDMFTLIKDSVINLIKSIPGVKLLSGVFDYFTGDDEEDKKPEQSNRIRPELEPRIGENLRAKRLTQSAKEKEEIEKMKSANQSGNGDTNIVAPTVNNKTNNNTNVIGRPSARAVITPNF